MNDYYRRIGCGHPEADDPTVEHWCRPGDRYESVTEDLLTRAEWEASIDYEAAEWQFPLFTDDGHEYQLGHRSLQEWVRRIVNAALNVKEDS